MRTLVVEDDPLQRDLVVAGLRELGHEVTAVADGNAGLITHLQRPFDMLVLDWVVPGGLDGLSLTQRIRSMPGGDQPYILVVTARDRPSDLAQVIDAGADDYLAKPVQTSLLQTRVRIAERRLASSARHQEDREALARSEVDFRRVIERCPLGIVAFCDGSVVYVNSAAARALGHEREALIGRPMLDLVPEPRREATARRIDRFERTDVPPPPIESEFLCADGTPMTTWVIPMTRASFDGRRASFLMFEDITERKAAERELRLTQFAIDHAADLALWVGRDGRICYANDVACRALGYVRGKLVGLPTMQIDPSAHESWASGRAAGGRKFESNLRTREGDTFPVEISTAVLRFHGDEYVIAFARDLTERKRLQQSLQKADRLASVGSLAAGVAHEINNPLAYVIANLELITEDLAAADADLVGRVSGSVASTLAEALEGAHRVRRIVGDLKSFARADDEELGAVDVHDVIDAAVDIAANEIRHRARLERRYGEVARVRGNAGRLTQVFLNLLVNAAHAIPEGDSDRHRITIRSREQSDAVMVEISDTGGGIPEGIVDRIFDPFFTTKPQGMGTGLGLSICHGIVSSIGGEIRVDSRTGSGSTFRVLLPRATATGEVRPDSEPPVMAALPARPLSILVVDDEPLIGEGIRRALRGHRVEVARGGREAILRCQQADFDLVLCDVMMPDVSGMEVYGTIRSAKPALEGRFVFMTGGAFTPKARAFLESVDAERIDKPFSLRELRTLVNRRAEAS